MNRNQTQAEYPMIGFPAHISCLMGDQLQIRSGD